MLYTAEDAWTLQGKNTFPEESTKNKKQLIANKNKTLAKQKKRKETACRELATTSGSDSVLYLLPPSLPWREHANTNRRLLIAHRQLLATEIKKCLSQIDGYLATAVTYRQRQLHFANRQLLIASFWSHAGPQYVAIYTAHRTAANHK